MEIKDNAIVLSIKHHSEKGIIGKFLTKDHGLIVGYIRKTKKMPSIMPANHVSLVYRSRLRENMGNITLDIKNFYSFSIMQSKRKLFAFNSMSALVIQLCKENEVYSLLFEHILNWLKDLSNGDDFSISNYLFLELFLLKEIGFPIDLTYCAAGGDNQNLAFVSPKTGRSISYDKGVEFSSKLIILPSFLIERAEPKLYKELSQAFDLIDYFYYRYILREYYIKEPNERKLLKKTLYDFLEQELKNELNKDLENS